MFIGSLRVELFVPSSNSLKHKRQVLSSLKQRIRNNFNVAIAEEAIDKWQRAVIFIVGVNGKKAHLEKTFSTIEKMLHYHSDTELINTELELL